MACIYSLLSEEQETIQEQNKKWRLEKYPAAIFHFAAEYRRQHRFDVRCMIVYNCCKGWKKE